MVQDDLKPVDLSNPEQTVASLKATIEGGENSMVKEQAIYKLGELHAKLGQVPELAKLLTVIRPFFSQISKAKTAKIVRTLIELVAKIPNTLNIQVELCKESIAWTRQENRNFLRQRIETKLVALYLETKEYQAALALITSLLREVKKLDDKALLVEIQLLESQVHHSLRNLPKAKAALTAARTSANAIYCPPSLQAQIDLQAGILHAEEKDYKTAYSYFYESYETSDSLDDPVAVSALKYMLLCKIMIKKPEDVQAIVSGKLALKYAGREVDAMRAIANALSNRSLKDFEQALANFKSELTDDEIVHVHLAELYDTLLEQNLLRIIEPFSCVEITHVATLINLSLLVVERKLSQMILDKKLHGILDQGNGCLIVFDSPIVDNTYPSAIETIENMGKVVDLLYEKVKKLG